MQMCEYGSGCSRPDCIYRHDESGKAEEVCLPFLAGKCTFDDEGCRKRHPTNEAKDRLVAKYKRTRCRFADECYTENCLYLHPAEIEPVEPAYIEPTSAAFPPLNGAAASGPPKTLSNSAWKVAPAVVPQCMPAQPVAWYPAPMWGPGYEMDPTAYAYGEHVVSPNDPSASPISFNVNAKEFVPASGS
jgi:hypothetical protein